MINGTNELREELGGPSKPLVTALAAAEVLYSLNSMEKEGMKPYGDYATSALLELAGTTGDFKVPVAAAHFFAWHYMYKYDGSNATARDMAESLAEYVKSDFTPWGTIEGTGDGATCTYISGRSIVPLIQKLESARAVLYIASASAAAGNEAIKGIKREIGSLRLRAGFLHIDLLLGDTEYNPLFGSQFKPKARAILGEILKASEIADDLLPASAEISAMISLNWDAKKEINIKSVLAEMEAVPSQEVCGLLRAMEQHADTKSSKETISASLAKAMEGNIALRGFTPTGSKKAEGPKLQDKGGQQAKTNNTG
ncbi:MAG: hypothetical protein WC506_06505 [Candidatus Micrarchaeia archaeon]